MGTYSDLRGKVAIVTGSGRPKGLGEAMVKRLAAEGCKVVVSDLGAPQGEAMPASAIGSASDMDKIVTEIREAGGEAIGLTCNVLVESEVEALVARTVEHYGRVDIMVNNAGIAGSTKKLWELSPEEWKQVVEIDLIGVFHCCRSVVPHMMEKKYGRIVNIASVAGKEGNPNASHYSAAKAGVIALTKSLGKELAQSNILVNCITPAVIETDILKQVTQQHIDYMLSKIPMGRFGKKEEAAAMVAWLASEDCSFTTGSTFDLSGGRATY